MNAAVVPSSAAAMDLVLQTSSADDLRRELSMERLRRQVYESVARQELLSHTLGCLVEMIERETPRLYACLVFHSTTEVEALAASESVVGRGGDAMVAECHDLAVRRGCEAGAFVEQYEQLTQPPQWFTAETDAAFWSLPLPGPTASEPIVGALFLLKAGAGPATDAERAIARLAAELSGFAISRTHAAELTQRQSMHDPLTNLPNIGLLKDRLAQSVEIARRQESTTAILLIDVDGLRVVNETLGRSAGDDLLCTIATRLRGSLRRSDTIARIGGSKFALIATVKNATRDVTSVANKVISAVTTPTKLCGHEVAVGVHAGISLFPTDADTVADLLQKAELALHRAKARGRNTVQFFKPDPHTDGLADLALEGQLRRAVEFALMSQALGGDSPAVDAASGTLQLHYQPQVDQNGRVVGVEALARWFHPTLGRVPPDRFISIAERCGLIVPFGRWAMREAAAQAKRWVDIFGPAAPRMAVNVSAVQFAMDGFLDDVAAVLAACKTTPGMLELELTESVLMEDATQAAERIGKLREMGVAVAIDDFGTGYSSLAYLHRLTIDTLKVDRSFVAGMSGERRPPDASVDAPLQKSGAAVTRAIISMGKSLGVNVLAEGVENQAQQQLLIRMGCDQMQGYLFSPPVPAARLQEMLVEGAGVLPLPVPLAASA